MMEEGKKCSIRNECGIEHGFCSYFRSLVRPFDGKRKPGFNYIVKFDFLEYLNKEEGKLEEIFKICGIFYDKDDCDNDGSVSILLNYCPFCGKEIFFDLFEGREKKWQGVKKIGVHDAYKDYEGVYVENLMIPGQFVFDENELKKHKEHMEELGKKLFVYPVVKKEVRGRQEIKEVAGKIHERMKDYVEYDYLESMLNEAYDNYEWNCGGRGMYYPDFSVGVSISADIA